MNVIMTKKPTQELWLNQWHEFGQDPLYVRPLSVGVWETSILQIHVIFSLSYNRFSHFFKTFYKLFVFIYLLTKWVIWWFNDSLHLLLHSTFVCTVVGWWHFPTVWSNILILQIVCNDINHFAEFFWWYLHIASVRVIS